VPNDVVSDLARIEKFVVDGILPCNLVHLLAAPVGIGKTTLIMQLLQSMKDGTLWLTKQAYPRRVVYISADRGKQETDSTLERLGLTGLEFKLVSLKDTKCTTISTLEFYIDQNCLRRDLVIVEPLNFFLRDGNKTGDINNFGHVSRFLLAIGKKAEELQLTILGSLHSSKAKQGSQYMVAREKVIGSIAWTAFTATTIVLEPSDPTVCDDPGRLIHVLPRDMRPFTLEYTVEPERGLLIQRERMKPMKNKLEEYFEGHEAETFTSEDMKNWAEKAGISESTMWRWLKQKVRDGYVIIEEPGLYRKAKLT
jgi:RecA-family ATPase